MLKVVCLFARKPGLTPEQFRDYYEKNHAPLAIRLLPFFKDYRRNYVRRDKTLHSKTSSSAGLDFDVVTEFTFENESAYERFEKAISDPAIAKQIADDEENFMNRTNKKSFLVYEDVTLQAKLKEFA